MLPIRTIKTPIRLLITRITALNTRRIAHLPQGLRVYYRLHGSYSSVIVIAIAVPLAHHFGGHMYSFEERQLGVSERLASCPAKSAAFSLRHNRIRQLAQSFNFYRHHIASLQPALR